jgi:hypothetical protein
VSLIVTLHLAANLIWIFSLSGKKIISHTKRFYLRLKHKWTNKKIGTSERLAT